MKYKLPFKRLLIFVYTLATILSASHIHKDMNSSSSQCKICVLTQNMHGGDLAETSDSIVLLSAYIIQILIIDKPIPYRNLKGFNSQAPPLFS